MYVWGKWRLRMLAFLICKNERGVRQVWKDSSLVDPPEKKEALRKVGIHGPVVDHALTNFHDVS